MGASPAWGARSAGCRAPTLQGLPHQSLSLHLKVVVSVEEERMASDGQAFSFDKNNFPIGISATNIVFIIEIVKVRYLLWNKIQYDRRHLRMGQAFAGVSCPALCHCSLRPFSLQWPFHSFVQYTCLLTGLLRPVVGQTGTRSLRVRWSSYPLQLPEAFRHPCAVPTRVLVPTHSSCRWLLRCFFCYCC